jgi:hypothetical protein
MSSIRCMDCKGWFRPEETIYHRRFDEIYCIGCYIAICEEEREFLMFIESLIKRDET